MGQPTNQPPATPAGGKVVALPFGKHKGTPLAEVPTGYLNWLIGQGKLSTGIRQGVADELRRRGLEPPPPPPPAPPPECQKCGQASVRCGWLQQRDGRRAIRRSCAGCGGSLGTAPLTEENIRLADAAKSSSRPLALLAEADQRGMRLVSDGTVASVHRDDWRKADADFRDRLRQHRHSLGRLLGVRRAEPQGEPPA
jgi:hypothetical protein